MSTRYLVAFWNLENLFAPEGFVGREPWIASRLASDLHGWTETLFDRKLDQLTRVIAAMNGGNGPDLLGVCEVENRFVLDRLVSKLDAAVPERRYDVIHADSERDQRGIDTAFLFDSNRVGVNPQEVFSHWVLRRTGTRDITQVTFILEDRELVALANHWPSRSGGTEISSGFRAVAGETLGYWHERIREVKGPDVAVLAMGDLNDDPFDNSVTVNANATREKTDVLHARSARFYNLSWHYLAQQVDDFEGNSRPIYGTLYYSGDANLFDQILVSRGMIAPNVPLRCLDDTARIEAFAPMVDQRLTQGPIRFGLAKGDAAANVNTDGFSDHFPVSVILETN